MSASGNAAVHNIAVKTSKSLSKVACCNSLLAAIRQHKQGLDDCGGIRRAAGEVNIYGQQIVDSVAAGVSSADGTARNGTRSGRHHPVRFEHRMIGLEQRIAHRIRNGSGYRQEVRKARGGREEYAQAMQIVEGIT